MFNLKDYCKERSLKEGRDIATKKRKFFFEKDLKKITERSKMKTGIFTQKEKEEEEKDHMISIRYGEEFFTVKDIMKWLPYKAGTICKYLEKGKINGRKIGKKWYVTRQDFYKYLEGK